MRYLELQDHLVEHARKKGVGEMTLCAFGALQEVLKDGIGAQEKDRATWNAQAMVSMLERAEEPAEIGKMVAEYGR